MNPYAYVGDNPETRNDPTGHCWPLCTMILGAIIGAAVSVTTTVVADAVQGKTPSLGEVAQAAVVGAVSGAVSGLVGPEAGPLVKVAVGALASGAGQIAGNAMSGKPLLAGVGTAVAVGALTGGLMEGAGSLFKGATSDIGEAADSTLSDAVDSCGLSFRADTLVATPKGEQAIGTLNVGSKVQAYNPATKTTSTQTVQQVFLNHDTDLLDVTLAVHASAKQTKPQRVAVVSHGSHAPPVTFETVHSTQKHPWLTTRGWITAGKLRVGDRVRQLDGMTATVVALKAIPGAADMYDLTVSNVHTFAVGDNQFIVHNCDEVRKLDPNSYHQMNSSGGGRGGKSPFDLFGQNAQDALDSAIPNKSGRHLVVFYNSALYIFKHELTQTAVDDAGNEITTSFYHGYRVSAQDLTTELQNNTTQSIRRQLVNLFGAPSGWLRGAPWGY